MQKVGKVFRLGLGGCGSGVGGFLNFMTSFLQRDQN